MSKHTSDQKITIKNQAKNVPADTGWALADDASDDDLLLALGACFEVRQGARTVSSTHCVDDAQLRREQLELALCNGDAKTVVRGQLLITAVDERRLRYLRLLPMRGYGAEFVQALACVQPLLRDAAALDSRTLPIRAAMPTEQAVRLMAHGMLEQAQQHLGGVVADIDSEFLHAYRVNLRKTRSLLSLLKKALPPATMDKLKPRLAAMAGATNALRDLDVYLLAQHQYRALLPTEFGAGMDQLAERVAQRRAAEQQRVAVHLLSPAYQADVDACLAELSRHALLATPTGAKPVLRVVRRQLLKRYAAIAAQVRLIPRDCADDALHAVRIECKKLRYLIEFFAELLPKKRVTRMLADLKQMQSVLGEFNDFSVQIGFLAGFRDGADAPMAQALSGLTAVLHLKMLAARERIFAAIDGYFTENRAIEFDLLFTTCKLEKLS